MTSPLSPHSRALPSSPAHEEKPKAVPCKRFSVSLGVRRPAGAPAAVAPTAAAPSAPAPAGPLSAPARTITRLLADEKRVDQGLARALRGGSMSPQALLALQVNVIRYSQELEVASRLVEKLTGAVKQTLQSQV
jgi:hypothetical protein